MGNLCCPQKQGPLVKSSTPSSILGFYGKPKGNTSGGGGRNRCKNCWWGRNLIRVNFLHKIIFSKKNKGKVIFSGTSPPPPLDFLRSNSPRPRSGILLNRFVHVYKKNQETPYTPRVYNVFFFKKELKT